MQIQRVTYMLFALVITTAALAFAQGRKQTTPSPPTPQPSPTEVIPLEIQQSRNSFPIADYEENEPSDPVKRAVRKEKQKRYDDYQVVTDNPNPNTAEVSVHFEGPRLPALPLDKSNVILVGSVKDVQAHLSDNKKNIYSEFTVAIKDVLKAEVSLPPNNLITLDRQGGYVNYPNGQKVLYRSEGEKMPEVGKRYVFFLKVVNQDFRILTAYQLDNEDRVLPLDEQEQYGAYKGTEASSFLNNVRDSLVTTSPRPE